MRFPVSVAVVLMAARVLVAPAFAASLAPPGTKAYEGWTLTCDNTGACVVLGAADADDLVYLRIARDAGATASPVVKLVDAAQEAFKGGSPAFRLEAVTTGTATALGSFPRRVARTIRPRCQRPWTMAGARP